MTALLTIRLAGSVVHSYGANHGVGFDQALANTRRMWAEWVARGREAGRLDKFELDEAIHQESLFTIGAHGDHDR